MKTPQIEALAGCTPLGLKPLPTMVKVTECNDCAIYHEGHGTTVCAVCGSRSLREIEVPHQFTEIPGHMVSIMVKP